VAQKTQPIAQPTCELMQAVTRPVKRMSTVSMFARSARVSRYLRVKPSLESVSRAVGSTPSLVSAASRRRTLAGSFGMADRESAHSQ
jgi:hypothetical protein